MANNTQRPPLVFFGDVEDASLWGGNASAAGGAEDPLGGTAGYTVTDDDALVSEALNLSDSPNVTHSDTVVALAIKKGSGVTVSEVFWFDVTAVATRARIRITWGPPVTAVLDFGSAPFVWVSLGNDWYALVMAVANVVAGNNNQVRIRPAVTASETGTVLIYPRPFALFSHFDSPVAWPEARGASEQIQLRSGLEEAWVTGFDALLGGTLRHIPLEVTTGLENTPWSNDQAGQQGVINYGVQDWLRWAQNKNTFDWVPDRTDCAKYHTAYLVEPLRGRPPLESGGLRQLPVIMRTADGSRWRGY